MDLPDWIYRTLARGVLQLPHLGAMGIRFDFQRAGECGLNGGDFAFPVATSGIPLAVDPELGRADRNQHVALSVVSVVRSIKPLWLDVLSSSFSLPLA